MQFEYKTKGTCSQQIIFEIEDGAANLYCLGYGAMEERRPSGEWRTTPYMK